MRERARHGIKLFGCLGGLSPPVSLRLEHTCHSLLLSIRWGVRHCALISSSFVIVEREQ